MKESEIEALSIAIAKALQQARSVSDSEHYDHHVWISEKIKRERAWVEFWEKMIQHATKWGMISFFSAAFYAMWLGFKTYAKAHGVNIE